MGLRDLATYGFRSWMLQDFDRPYEVILNLFVPAARDFEKLTEGKNPHCIPRIVQHESPAYFNISASNNIGLHLAKGEYVLFANVDMIFPGHFLRVAMGEMIERKLCYAVAARLNMNAGHASLLKPVMQHTTADRFDCVMGLEQEVEANILPAISPWMFRRDIAMTIGGFDAKILFAEDRDLQDRAMHYLRRTGQQQALHSLADLYGYHQWHPTTGLFNAFHEIKERMESRKRRMDADPNSTEDCLDTPLNDYEALVRDIRETKPPPFMNQYRKDLGGKLKLRAKKVWKAIKYGT